MKKTLSILKEPQKKKKNLVLFLDYITTLSRNKLLLLPNWPIQSSKFHTKIVLIRSKSKGQRNLKTGTHTQMLNCRSCFPLPVQRLLFCSNLYMPHGTQPYMPHGTQPFNIKRYQRRIQAISCPLNLLSRQVCLMNELKQETERRMQAKPLVKWILFYCKMKNF